MYQFFCRVAENPCPVDQQASVNDVVFAINPDNILLAFAAGFMLVMTPAFICWAAGSLLRMVDRR